MPDPEPAPAGADDAPLEIERVYLLDRLPELPPGAEAHRIEQGYLPDVRVPGAAGAFPEGRVRRITAPDGQVRWIHTVKRGAGLVRTERERDLSETEFDAAWARTAGRRLTKTRFKVREGDLTWEVDRFDAWPLVLAEVELPRPDAEVSLPGWLAPHVVRELTWDPRYRNYALATLGPPEA